MIGKGLFFLILILFLVQCKPAEKDDKIVAKVYNATLYESDLRQNVELDEPENKSEVVDSWIRKQLLLRNAKLTKKDKSEIEDLTEKYRESLIIQHHKERIVSKKLDKKINEEVLLESYEDLKENFHLRSNIYKMQLYIVDIAHFDKLDLKSFFKKKEYEEFYNSLDNQIVMEFSDTSKWKSWASISQYIPKDLLSEDEIGGKKDYILENDKYIFFLKVLEMIDKNETAPLSYMSSYIEQAILEKRKEKLLDEYSTDLYKTGLKNNKIQIN